jgi:hypothetical protein
MTTISGHPISSRGSSRRSDRPTAPGPTGGRSSWTTADHEAAEEDLVAVQAEEAALLEAGQHEVDLAAGGMGARGGVDGREGGQQRGNRHVGDLPV